MTASCRRRTPLTQSSLQTLFTAVGPPTGGAAGAATLTGSDAYAGAGPLTAGTAGGRTGGPPGEAATGGTPGGCTTAAPGTGAGPTDGATGPPCRAAAAAARDGFVLTFAGVVRLVVVVVVVIYAVSLEWTAACMRRNTPMIVIRPKTIQEVAMMETTTRHCFPPPQNFVAGQLFCEDEATQCKIHECRIEKTHSHHSGNHYPHDPDDEPWDALRKVWRKSFLWRVGEVLDHGSDSKSRDISDVFTTFGMRIEKRSEILTLQAAKEL